MELKQVEGKICGKGLPSIRSGLIEHLSESLLLLVEKGRYLFVPELPPVKSYGCVLFSFLMLCLSKDFLNPAAKQKEGCEDLVPRHTAKGQKLNEFQITQ